MFRKIYERLTDKEPILIGTEQINIKPFLQSSPFIVLAGVLGFYAGQIKEAIDLQWNPTPLVERLSEEQLKVLRDATIKALQDK